MTKLAFACPICGYVIRAQYDGTSLDDHRIMFEGAKRTFPGEVAYPGQAFGLPIGPKETLPPTVTVGLSIPLDPEARDLSDPFAGPNITFRDLFGEKSIWAIDRYHQMRALRPQWELYQRFLHFYLNGDLKRFSKVGEELFIDGWIEPRNVQERHILALQPAFVFLLPNLPGDFGQRMLEDHANAVLATQTCAALAEWAMSQEASGALATMQRDLLECLRDYIDKWEMWLPGLIYTMEEVDAGTLARLRLGRDEFGSLRDVYVHTYETSCRGLTLAIALMNSAHRGSPDAFPDVPTAIKLNNKKATPPSSLAAYRALPNSTKLQWFVDWPEWNVLLPELLDKDVRNAIGHASARHNIQSGMIESDKFTMPYGKLAAKVLLLGHILLIQLQIVKTLRLLVADKADSSHD